MKNKRHRKKTRKIFNRELMGDFEKRLAAYGLTAAVLLACPQSAKATVWDIDDITLGSGEYLALNLITGIASLGAGTRPYGVSTQGSFAIDNLYSATFIGPASSSFAGFVGTGGFTTVGFRYAAVLNGPSVGSTPSFAANSAIPSWGNYCGLNGFYGTTGKFVGLRFKIGSDIHYGWAQIDVSTLGVVTLNEFGNDIPVPEPSSLGLLAFGAAGLARRRRKKNQV